MPASRCLPQCGSTRFVCTKFVLCHFELELHASSNEHSYRFRHQMPLHAAYEHVRACRFRALSQNVSALSIFLDYCFGLCLILCGAGLLSCPTQVFDCCSCRCCLNAIFAFVDVSLSRQFNPRAARNRLVRQQQRAGARSFRVS